MRVVTCKNREERVVLFPLKGVYGSRLRLYLGFKDLRGILNLLVGNGMIALQCDYVWCKELKFLELLSLPWIGLLLLLIWISNSLNLTVHLTCDC
jgi:hypothetical protein